MMTVRAAIYWKHEDEGGRKRPPLGQGKPEYHTVVRVLGIDNDWPPKNAWSLVVEKIPEQSSEFEWVANVRYLVEKAPHHELVSGREFELYEGPTCVATGRLM